MTDQPKVRKMRPERTDATRKPAARERAITRKQQRIAKQRRFA